MRTNSHTLLGLLIIIFDVCMYVRLGRRLLVGYVEAQVLKRDFIDVTLFGENLPVSKEINYHVVRK